MNDLARKNTEIRRLKQEIKDFADYRALKREQIQRLKDELNEYRINQMGRQIPTECIHGVVLDPGDFDAKVEKCPYCDRAENFSYDTRCAKLADVFLSEETPATMPNDVYAGHVARLAQGIPDCVQLFSSYDEQWVRVLDKREP